LKQEIQKARSRNPHGFRPDINGLRAWAVMAVVLYHFGISGFQGGFIGVDVFFVLSGYLMTRIIIGSLNNPRKISDFSMLGFYLARARRIIPALLLMCLVLLCLGWLFLPALEYRQLGQHAAAALVFGSNFKFWFESGYFDVGSYEKWLLHTWSLSVEWQFYIIYPIILAGIWCLRPSLSAMKAVVCFLFFASLAFSIWYTPLDPGGAFYLLPARAWEMLAGALVFLFSDRLSLGIRPKKVMELLGLFLIAIGVLYVNPVGQWPGFFALIPVIGVVLVLTAARENSLWTGSDLAQFLGNASYSIYLWHWPIVVGLNYAGLKVMPAAVTVGIFFSIFLGYLSYRYIEQPSRKWLGSIKPSSNVLVISGVTVSVALMGAIIYINDGVYGRIDPEIDIIFSEANNKNPRAYDCHKGAPSKVPECVYGGQNLGVIVIGDSHAASLVRSIERALPSEQHVLDWTYSSCPTLLGVRFKDVRRGSHCGRFVKQSIDKASHLSYAPLLVVNNASFYIYGKSDIRQKDDSAEINAIYFDDPYEKLDPDFIDRWRKSLIDTACEFAKTRPVYLMRPIPEMHSHVPRVMGRAAMRGEDERVSISLADYHQRNRLVWEAQDAARDKCSIRILDPLPYLCSGGRCWGDKDGMPLYYDDDHLSERGASLLLPLFNEMLMNGA